MSFYNRVEKKKRIILRLFEGGWIPMNSKLLDVVTGAMARTIVIFAFDQSQFIIYSLETNNKTWAKGELI